jgi:hypothetical protein
MTVVADVDDKKAHGRKATGKRALGRKDLGYTNSPLS